MAAPTKNKWLTISLLAIILPVTLLVTFKLTGVIPEPHTPETITLEPVSWIMERPSDSMLNIGERVENAHADSEAAVGIGAHIAWYVDDPDPIVGPFYGRDGVCFIMYVNFSVFCGSGVSMVARCHPTDDNATVYVETKLLVQYNVSVTGIRWFGDGASEAYIATEISRSPCYLKAQVYWVFNDQNNEDHQLDVALETTYFNGATYRRLVLPINLQTLISTATKGS